MGLHSSLEKPGSGPLSLCMNYVGFGPVIVIASIENKPSLGKGFLRNLPKNLRFGTSSVALPFGLFGVSVMLECSIKNNGTSLKVKHIIWRDLNLYAKVDWERVLKYAKISAFCRFSHL